MKGKFDTEVAEYLYNLTLDGLGEEIHVDEDGWYTCISFGANEAIAVNSLLPESEKHGRCVYFDEPRDGTNPKEVATGYWGAILSEDTQGFVTVSLLETSMEADEEWHQILNGQLETA